MASPAPKHDLPSYGYETLIADDIRVIQLQPGKQPEGLYAEIIHILLKLPPEPSKQASTRISAINKSLRDGWQAFRTPEGRLFYQDMVTEDSVCQYDHPLRDSVPEELLAILEPGQGNDELELEIEEKDRFEALSYVWGDPTPKDNLYIQNREGLAATSQIPITANLSSALRHLRHSVKSRVLWVDAISINQTDDAEKNKQVLRIPDVYRSAYRVIAWLGEASADSGLALETMRYLGEQIEISQSTWQHLPPHAKEQDWVNMEFRLPYTIKQWQALTSLMARPWFRRVWVLQEITLANLNAIVQCGGDLVSYCLFRRAIVGLRGRPGMPDSLYERIEDKFTISYGLHDKSITELVSMAREHDCSVPHDRVYGLLGFIGSNIRKTVKPSYQTPFAQVFKDLFFAHSNATRRLDLLAHCFPSVDADIPSWVPDWRSFGDGATSIPSATTLSAGMSKADFREVQTGELEVSGIMHGKVTSTFKVLDSKKGDRIGPWLRKLIKGCIKSASYPTGENIREAFAKLLCRDQLRERFTEAQHFDTLDQWQETLGMLLARKRSKRRNDDDLEGFIRTQWGFWEWRRFFRTENGYFGLGSMDLAEGDEVCVLLGLYCPLVIRPSGDGRYKVIGGCYLHGLMDSEALLGPLPEGSTVHQHKVQGRSLPRYYNIGTKETTVEDPRLGTLEQHWERVEREMTADDPEHVDFFRNNDTGEEINYDPRLSRPALEHRGVKLQTITFV